MTYQDIANWAKKNVPMGLAEGSYSKWLGMVESEFLQSGHFIPKKAIPLIEKKWLSVNDQLEISGRDIAPPPPPPEPKLIRDDLESRFERLPSDIEFTPKQVSQWTGFNKNTIRREMQEAVERGTLQRISKGRYRLAP
jgi:hypothetical protein